MSHDICSTPPPSPCKPRSPAVVQMESQVRKSKTPVIFFFLGEGAQLIKHGTNEKVNRDDTAREKERGRLGHVCMTNVEVHDGKRGPKVEAHGDIVLLCGNILLIYPATPGWSMYGSAKDAKMPFPEQENSAAVTGRPLLIQTYSHILPAIRCSFTSRQANAVYVIQKARVRCKAVLSSIQ